MYYDEENGITYMSEGEYNSYVVEPLRARLYDVLTEFYGEMYEEGYAGYPGSSQSLNIDNTFATVTDELVPHVIDLLAEHDLAMTVQIEG